MLIGRDHELGLIRARLSERRLVTLIGPGGIGKTTLARSVAAAVGGEYPEGAHFVDLTRAGTSEAVQESLAGQLGYTSFTALTDSPGDHPALVVVDNCEHVVDAAADAIQALLESCEMPTVLATSRIALDIPGEAVVPLGPLALPPAEMLDAPAVRLFVERARDAGVELPITEAVAELCRRLDGIPLAIELAAARTPAMTPGEILDRLAAGLDVLDRPRRRTATRHRGLRAAIGWSFELLEPDDQETLAALSVLTGPFTVELAWAVLAEPDLSEGAVQDRLDRLVSASMVVADPAGATTRYRMLDSVRHFGLEHLDADRRHRLEANHVDHVLLRVLHIIERAAGNWEATALAELLDLYDNVAAAIRWCLAHDDAPDRAFVFAAVLWGVIHQAHTEEVGELAERILERWAGTDHPMLADVAATAATCRYMLGDLDGAIDLAEAMLDGADRSPYAPATLRRALAQAHRGRGDVETASTWFAEAAEHARRLGLEAMAVESDCARAHLLGDVGRVDDALALIADARGAARRAGSEIGATWSLAVEGSILLRRDTGAATAALERALAEARRIEYAAAISVTQRGLALAALCGGDRPLAAARIGELLDDLLARGSTYELRMVFDVVSPLLRAVGRTGPAADLAATALALPVVSVTASVDHELCPLDPTGGTRLATRDAILVVRDELLRIAEPEDTVAPARVDGSPTVDEGTGSFVRRGDVFEVHYRGESVAVRANKGLEDIAVLLGEPGREFHCLELAGSGVDESDTGALLDAAARRAYEDRVRDLQSDIDDAEEHHDIVRAERAREELDVVVDQLTAALGLGGRERTAGATAERARSAVTQRIRGSIRKLEAMHPALGRHLRASVRTGQFCSYQPERPTTWEV